MLASQEELPNRKFLPDSYEYLNFQLRESKAELLALIPHLA